jgi:mRNA interferase RelE/StbE
VEVTYRILFRQRAERDLALLSKADTDRVITAIRNLAEDPRPPGCLKLRDRAGWRIRAGDYRILYEIFDEEKVIHIE